MHDPESLAAMAACAVGLTFPALRAEFVASRWRLNRLKGYRNTYFLQSAAACVIERFLWKDSSAQSQ